MLDLPPTLLARFLVIDVRDPDELGHDSAVSRRFPSSNNAHRYRLRHAPPPLRRPAPGEDVLMRLAMCPAGELMAAYVADRHAAEVRIAAPGVDRYCFGVVPEGSLKLRCVGGQEVEAGGSRGLMLRGTAGQCFESSAGNARFNLWIDAGRVDGTLASLLGRAPARPLQFEAGVDLAGPHGAALLRLLGHFAHEIARPDGLLASPLALASFTELWVQTLLHALPHNHREAMVGRHAGQPVPGHVKRAEDYMRRNVHRPIGLAEVADASGCSLRTLHAAFRRFRETTPLAALHGVRLDAVREVLAAGAGEARPAEVARQHGFTHPGRFKAAYLRRFGTLPPGSRRR